MRMWISLLALFLTFSARAGGADEPPAWASRSISRMFRSEVVSIAGSGCGSRVETRYLDAVYSHCAYVNLKSALDYLEGRSEDDWAYKSLVVHKVDLGSVSSEVVALVDEFKPELVRLGADFAAMFTECQTFKARFRVALAARAKG